MSDEAQPFVRGSETSQEAAILIGPAAKTLEAKVLRYLIKCDNVGATDGEAQPRLFMDGDTYRPRRVNLVKIGMVEDSGRTRKTETGRKATVWVVTEKGRRWAQELEIQARNGTAK